MGLTDKNYKCKYKCNCEGGLCSLADLRENALKSDDIELVKETLKEYTDLWLNVADDLSYHQCLLDGSNPIAEEVLTRKLKEIKEKKKLDKE